MNDEQTLLAALARHPGDDLAWLALADWLEETGQVKRAELLRLTRRLHYLDRVDPRRPTLERSLVAQLKKKVRPFVPEMTSSIGMRFTLVPPGTFWMGSPEDEDERHSIEHLHEVELARGFWMGTFPVTQEQYRRVMGVAPSYFAVTGEGRDYVVDLDTSDFPVEQVSWEGAAAFCAALSRLPAERKAKRKYRLPTEAEWEYACRAGTTTPFYLGKSLSSRQANFDGTEPGGHGARSGPNLERTTRVGAYLPNAFGLYDMVGNVWEWCSDFYDENYARVSPLVDPTGPKSGDRHVLRGGSWYHYGNVCRSATRIRYAREIRSDNGLRVVLVPPEG